jgi:hypothetical protein
MKADSSNPCGCGKREYCAMRKIEAEASQENPYRTQEATEAMELATRERELLEAQKRFREERQKRIDEGRVTVEEWLKW